MSINVGGGGRKLKPRILVIGVGELQAEMQ